MCCFMGQIADFVLMRPPPPRVGPPENISDFNTFLKDLCNELLSKTVKDPSEHKIALTNLT